MQSRYYDPALGRFINADSYASTGDGYLGYNMFAYCNNNPTNSADPSGASMIRPNVMMTDGPGAKSDDHKDNWYTARCEEPINGMRTVGDTTFSYSITHINFTPPNTRVIYGGLFSLNNAHLRVTSLDYDYLIISGVRYKVKDGKATAYISYDSGDIVMLQVKILSKTPDGATASSISDIISGIIDNSPSVGDTSYTGWSGGFGGYWSGGIGANGSCWPLYR